MTITSRVWQRRKAELAIVASARELEELMGEARTRARYLDGDSELSRLALRVEGLLGTVQTSQDLLSVFARELLTYRDEVMLELRVQRGAPLEATRHQTDPE